MPSTFEDLKEMIDSVAKKVARDYPDVDWEDLRQQLVVFVLENGKSLKLRSEGGNPRKILTLVAESYSKKLRVQHLTLTPQYAYRPSDVMLILETCFNPDMVQAGYVPDDARDPLSKTFNVFDDEKSFAIKEQDYFHMADAMEVSSDVKRAFLLLKVELQEALLLRYGLGQVPDNSSWQRKRLNKAVNELTYRLNTYRGDVFDKKQRKSMRNAAARVRFSEGWDE